MTGGHEILRGLGPVPRRDAAVLYWQAFPRKLGAILGPEDWALDFLTEVLDPAHCLSAICRRHGQLLGVAGFKTVQGAFVGGGYEALRRVYGPFGALWRAALLALLDRPLAPGVLLMDGIAVASAARGKGIGTDLLVAIESEAADRGLRAVRLDVIDRNPRARALYERCGYVPTATQSVGIMGRVLGFSSSTTMVKALGERKELRERRGGG
ncbi:MAG: GNAT family N-acetyltransferase [Pseudomonadota bacterium]